MTSCDKVLVSRKGGGWGYTSSRESRFDLLLTTKSDLQSFALFSILPLFLTFLSKNTVSQSWSFMPGTILKEGKIKIKRVRKEICKERNMMAWSEETVYTKTL